MKFFLACLFVAVALMAGARAAAVLTARDVAAPLPTPYSPRALAAAGEPRIVGQIGGALMVSDHDGSRSYLAVGPRVHVIDVADPRAPEVVGSSPLLAGPVHDLEVDRGHLFVAHGAGLTVFDARDPRGLVFADQWRLGSGDGSTEVVLNDGYVYVSAMGRGFPQDVVLDAADLRDIQLVGPLGDEAPKHALTQSGMRLYGAMWGLFVFDLENAATPRFLRRVDLSDDIFGLAANERSVFAGRSSDLLILDANNLTDLAPPAGGEPPDTPGPPPVHTQVPITSTPVAPRGSVVSIETMGRAAHIALNEDTAYVAGPGGLRAIDVSDRSRPATRWAVPAGQAEHVDLVGRYAYVSSGADGLRVFDLTDPNAARPIAVDGPVTFGPALDVARNGTLAYVATGDSGLQIVDVEDPANPVLVGRMGPGDWPAELGPWVPVERVTFHEQHVYALGPLGADQVGLLDIDVQDPAAPVPVGGRVIPGTVGSVFALGTRLFVASGAGGLSVVRRDLGLEHRVGEGWIATDVAVQGNSAYVLDPQVGLRVVDLSSVPPVEVKTVEFYVGYWNRALDLQAGLLWVPGLLDSPPDDPFAEPGVDILSIDVSDPGNAHVVRALPVNAHVRDVHVADRMAYVAVYGTEGGQARYHASPQVLGVPLDTGTGGWRLEVPDAPGGLAVSGTTLIVAAAKGGLIVANMDLDVPATPTLEGLPTPLSTLDRPPRSRTATPTPVRHATSTALPPRSLVLPLLAR